VNLFSISELQRFSGIKAHTIRVWEQRYNALKPDRSEGNTRYYNGAQLKRLLNIVSLLDKGYKVSDLCSMSDEQLNKLLDNQFSKLTSADSSYEYFISQIISAAMELNELRFDKIFSNCILRFGIKDAYIKVIYPILVRLGLMWSKDSLHAVQEHFVTHLINQKLMAAVDALPPPHFSKKTWLLFLPEDEFHVTGLLFSNYLIRQAGKKVIYLGANVPYYSLKSAIEEIKPACILFFLVHKNNMDEDISLINVMLKNFPRQMIYVGCEASRLHHLKATKNLIQLNSVEDLENELEQNV
jgi:DNA-binding transcriptional MerR regulator